MTMWSQSKNNMKYSLIQLPSVIPAKAGIHTERVLFDWIPAFAGMTIGLT